MPGQPFWRSECGGPQGSGSPSALRGLRAPWAADGCAGTRAEEARGSGGTRDPSRCCAVTSGHGHAHRHRRAGREDLPSTERGGEAASHLRGSEVVARASRCPALYSGGNCRDCGRQGALFLCQPSPSDALLRGALCSVLPIPGVLGAKVTFLQGALLGRNSSWEAGPERSLDPAPPGHFPHLDPAPSRPRPGPGPRPSLDPTPQTLPTPGPRPTQAPPPPGPRPTQALPPPGPCHAWTLPTPGPCPI